MLLAISSINAQVVRNRGVLLQDNSDDDYYYALIEATKQYLLQHYQEAVALYIECLKYKPESAAVNFQLSQIFLKAGDVNRAEEYAHRAFQNDLTNKWYLINLINLYQSNGKYDSAVVMMEKLIEIVPYNLEYTYLLSGLYEQIGDYSSAMDCLNEVEAQLGMSKEILIAKYGIYQQAGKDEEAFEVLKKAKAYFSDDYAIDGMMAEYFRDHMAYDSAKVYYEHIIPEYIDHVDVAVSYSDFLLETGKTDSALQVMVEIIKSNEVELRAKESFFYQVLQDDSRFMRLSRMTDTLSSVFLEVYPEDIGVQSIYADIQMRLGHYASASQMLKAIFQNDESNYIALEQLIYLENLMDNQDSIIKYARLAVNTFRSRPVPYLYLGSSLLQMQEYEEAIRYLERGRRYVTNETLKVQYYSLMAENYYQVNQYDSTWSCFDVALEIDQGNMIINNNYAYYLAEQNYMLKEAERMSNLTIQRDPKNPTYLDTYAWILFKMGELKQAKKFIERALKNNGAGDAEILDHYGDILYELGKYKDSIEHWGKAIDFDPSKKEVISIKIYNAEQKVK